MVDVLLIKLFTFITSQDSISLLEMMLIGTLQPLGASISKGLVCEQVFVWVGKIWPNLRMINWGDCSIRCGGPSLCVHSHERWLLKTGSSLFVLIRPHQRHDLPKLFCYFIFCLSCWFLLLVILNINSSMFIFFLSLIVVIRGIGSVI